MYTKEYLVIFKLFKPTFYVVWTQKSDMQNSGVLFTMHYFQINFKINTKSLAGLQISKCS